MDRGTPNLQNTLTKNSAVYAAWLLPRVPSLGGHSSNAGGSVMSKRVADLLVDTLQLVMPPSPLIAAEAVIGVAVYSTREVLQGKGHDVWEMVVENIS
jgi:hypothetical protein